MKKNILNKVMAAGAFLLFAPLSSFLTSCEEDLPVYDDPQAMLNFVYTISSDTLLNYSFVYNGDKTQDTIWFEVSTIGLMSNQNRNFELQQILTGENDAVPGKHYVSFDDPAYRQHLYVPANTVTARVPVIVLKDPSLEEADVTLRLAIKDTETFKVGYKDRSFKVLNISNRISKPVAWAFLANWTFGNYGPVKHKFMIDHTGEKWDDDYLNNTLHMNSLLLMDSAYCGYLKSKLRKALNEENARRAAAGEGPLTEADGTLVSFPA